MYTPGTIIYFDPFYFKEGGSKPKYFIVLSASNSNAVLASLPTRTDCVPSSLSLMHGCINNDEINFNCYHFQSGKIIATNGWSFGLPTFVYGSQINDYEIDILSDVYQVENVEYQIIGCLKKDEYEKLLECFVNSKSVKKKFKEILKKIIHK